MIKICETVSSTIARELGKGRISAGENDKNSRKAKSLGRIVHMCLPHLASFPAQPARNLKADEHPVFKAAFILHKDEFDDVTETSFRGKKKTFVWSWD